LVIAHALAAAAVTLPAAPARAEGRAPVRLELAPLVLPPFYPSERLQLSWPVRPLRFTFTEVRPIGLTAALGPAEHFVAESVWWEAGRLSVRTRTESVEDLGLDCSGLTCLPTTELSVTGEVRLDLGAPASSRVVPETYAFTRYEQLARPGGGFAKPGPGHYQLGIGGLLDL
jgi:hypothetical protein